VHVIVIVMSIFATLIHAPRATNTVVLHRYRRRDPTVFLLDPVPLPTVTPLKRTEHEQMQASVVLRGSNARTHTRIRNSCNSTARITRTPTRARTRARAHTHTHILLAHLHCRTLPFARLCTCGTTTSARGPRVPTPARRRRQASRPLPRVRTSRLEAFGTATLTMVTA
jgi:hypothetical protein